MKINIPFQEQWRQPMLEGQKTCTSRTKRYGQEGDTFRIFNATFTLTKVEVIPLYKVARYYYKAEGLEHPDEFIEVWKQLHPRKGWLNLQGVWVHHFKRVENESKVREG